MSRTTSTYGTVIVGAGFAGLGTAIRLLQEGREDFVVLERGTEVGGTWRDNTYPGAACDIPSLLYSFSFAQNPDWSRTYSGSAEILAYIRHLVRTYDLERFIRFSTEVTGLAWDETAGTWTATTTDGPYVGRTAVMAPGALSNASFPAIRGLDDFEGHKVHSARWDHDYDFAGKRVAVIGTGASAVQIIPELVKQASSVLVFQRTPGWVTPRLSLRTPSWQKRLFRRVPAAQSLARKGVFYAHESVALGLVWPSVATTAIEGIARAQMRVQVKDPWLRRQLTPDFRAGCKRMLVSNDYYPALQAPNAKLITWPIATLSPRGVRTAAGLEHEVDCIVFATGFDVSKTGTPFPVTGVGGRQLAAEWSRGVSAYKSISVSGYPNLFFTFGPNSGPGHNSALVFMESQIAYALQGISAVLDGGLRSLDVRPEAQASHNEALQARLAKTTWNSGCASWYLTEDGFNGTMFPGFATQYARQMARLELADYEAVVREDRPARQPAAMAQ